MQELPIQLDETPESATIQASGLGSYELDIDGTTLDTGGDPPPGVYHLTVKTECGCFTALVHVPCPPPAIHQGKDDHEREAITECCG